MTIDIISRTTGGRAAAGAALLLGIFATANGAVMLVDPVGWYGRVPGVPLTGPYNAHFVRDIGLAFALAGLCFLAGARWRAHRVPLWGVGTAWLLGHALFHLWEVAAGICSTDAIPRDFLGVTLPGLAGLALTLQAGREA